VNAALLADLWASDRPLSEGEVLGRLGDPSLIGNTFVRLAGQLWYLIAATGGLAAAGVVLLVVSLRWPTRLVFGWGALGAVAATIAASSLMMSDATRVDHLVYGRYNEGLVPSLLVLGAVGLQRLRRPPDVLIAGLVTAGAMVALAVVTHVANGHDAFTGDVAPVNVLGILVWRTAADSIDLFAVTAAAVAVLGLLVVIRMQSLVLCLVAAAAFFAGSAVQVRHEVLVPWAAYWSDQYHLPDAVAAVENVVGQDVTVALDTAGYAPEIGGFYQFELLDQKVVRWSGRGGAPAPLVIAPQRWDRAVELDARLVYPEERFGQALWSLPGVLQDRLDDAGYLLSTKRAALPEASWKVGFDTPGTVRVDAGVDADVEIGVTHQAKGSPWPSLGWTGPTKGFMRVVLRWPAEAGRSAAIGNDDVGNVPRTLLPGQSAEVPVTLRVPHRRGTYELEVMFVQDKLILFPQRASITVVVR
jgi:hypothetical protein